MAAFKNLYSPPAPPPPPPPPPHPPSYRRLHMTQGQLEQVQKISSPPGFNTVQPVVSHYIKYAIPDHKSN